MGGEVLILTTELFYLLYSFKMTILELNSIQLNNYFNLSFDVGGGGLIFITRLLFV